MPVVHPENQGAGTGEGGGTGAVWAVGPCVLGNVLSSNTEDGLEWGRALQKLPLGFFITVAEVGIVVVGVQDTMDCQSTLSSRASPLLKALLWLLLPFIVQIAFQLLQDLLLTSLGPSDHSPLCI